MSQLRVYIKPFNDAGDYVSDWTDITDDVEKEGLSKLAFSSDLSDIDIGVIRNSNINLKLNNLSGDYADVGTNTKTIFRFKRAGSQIRITWNAADFEPIVGVAVAGESIVWKEVDLFKGLLDDDDSKMDVRDQVLSFTVLGRESVFKNVLVDDASSLLNDGDSASDVIFNILNQSKITALMNVSASNINPANDITIDDVSELNTKTVREALNKLLLVTNSILYISGDDIIVSARDATTSVQHNFNGPNSNRGPENILDIAGINNGVRRVINYVVWKNTTTTAKDQTSIDLHGYRKKEIGFGAVTNAATRESSAGAIKDEFATAREEFDLRTPLHYDTLDLFITDRVSIDYPNDIVSREELPIYGIAVYGEARYPKELTSFSVLPEDHYKIIGLSMDMKNETITYKMRAV